MEFMHQECDHCSEALYDIENNPDLQRGIEAVIYLPLEVTTREGAELKRAFGVGINYPVFILIDKQGKVYTRWTGYTGGAPVLIQKLQDALANLVTIDDRVTAFETKPTYAEALRLAKYFSDRQENLKAIEYYRRAVTMGQKHYYNYAYEIFQNAANACWKDIWPFDSLFPYIDAVYSSKLIPGEKLTYAADLLVQVARKFEKYDGMGPYILKGIEAASDNEKLQMMKHNLMADYTLYIQNDTTRALNIKKASLGPDWENQRDKFYLFAKWCLDRKINLDEALLYARRTIELTQPGQYRAKAYATVGEILLARGEQDEAVRMLLQAQQQDPDNETYQKRLEEILGE